MENSRNQKLRIGWVIALMALAVGYRVFAAGNSDLANTSPLMAMAFGGGLLLGLRFWWVPAALLVISDVALGFSAGTGVGSYTLLTSLCYTAAAFARLGTIDVLSPQCLNRRHHLVCCCGSAVFLERVEHSPRSAGFGVIRIRFQDESARPSFATSPRFPIKRFPVFSPG